MIGDQAAAADRHAREYLLARRPEDAVSGDSIGAIGPDLRVTLLSLAQQSLPGRATETILERATAYKDWIING